jgi:hypothetical protein
VLPASDRGRRVPARQVPRAARRDQPVPAAGWRGTSRRGPGGAGGSPGPIHRALRRAGPRRGGRPPRRRSVIGRD